MDRHDYGNKLATHVEKNSYPGAAIGANLIGVKITGATSKGPIKESKAKSVSWLGRSTGTAADKTTLLHVLRSPVGAPVVRHLPRRLAWNVHRPTRASPGR